MATRSSFAQHLTHFNSSPGTCQNTCKAQIISLFSSLWWKRRCLKKYQLNENDNTNQLNCYDSSRSDWREEIQGYFLYVSIGCKHYQKLVINELTHGYYWSYSFTIWQGQYLKFTRITANSKTISIKTGTRKVPLTFWIKQAKALPESVACQQQIGCILEFYTLVSSILFLCHYLTN